MFTSEIPCFKFLHDKRQTSLAPLFTVTIVRSTLLARPRLAPRIDDRPRTVQAPWGSIEWVVGGSLARRLIHDRTGTVQAPRGTVERVVAGSLAGRLIHDRAVPVDSSAGQIEGVGFAFGGGIGENDGAGA